jgi:hypothetical protein
MRWTTSGVRSSGRRCRHGHPHGGSRASRGTGNRPQYLRHRLPQLRRSARPDGPGKRFANGEPHVHTNPLHRLVPTTHRRLGGGCAARVGCAAGRPSRGRARRSPARPTGRVTSFSDGVWSGSADGEAGTCRRSITVQDRSGTGCMDDHEVHADVLGRRVR